MLQSLEKLSLSELNSLLMELFRLKTISRTPKDLLDAYKVNRFFVPSPVDPVSFLQDEVELLRHASRNEFQLMELSPLAPLGNCSVIATADQNKIVSALRGAEVVADATNVLALEAAIQRMKASFDNEIIHLAASHRHVRAQSFSGKGFSAHFKIFCAVSAGRDAGNFTFEKKVLLKHLAFYRDYFVGILQEVNVRIIIKSLDDDERPTWMIDEVRQEIQALLKDVDVVFVNVPKEDHDYYRGIRFSVNLVHKGSEYNIGDGGFTDWAEKLTSNKKERLLISGLGTEFLYKLRNGMLG